MSSTPNRNEGLEKESEGDIFVNPKSLKSTKPRCLFCMHCVSEEETFQQCFRDVPGAVSSVNLQRDLQSYFILSKLLNIPFSLLREQIIKKAGNGNGRSLLFQNWFHICTDCFERVSKAWDLYQNLLQVRSQLMEIKNGLKKKIIDSTQTFRSRIESEIVKEIRKHSRKSYRKEVLKKELPSIKTVVAQAKTDLLEAEDDYGGDESIALEIDTKENLETIAENVNTPNTNTSSEQERCLQNDFTDDENDADYQPHDDDDDADWELSTSMRQTTKSRRKSPQKTESPTKAAPVKKKRIRDRTKDKKRKRIWRKKPPKWPAKCDKCPAKYKLEEELTKHKEAHERNALNGDVFNCNFCNFPCDNLENLDKHKHEKHLKSNKSGKIKYKCKACPCTVRFYYQLEQHVRDKHPELPEEECGLKSLTCKICNQELANVNASSLHIKLMHPEAFGAQTEALLECEECGEKFESAIRLEYHQRGHIRERHAETIFTCEVCGKAFKWKSRLQQHILIHAKTKRWICSVCGLDFNFKHNLVRHIRKYHPQEKQLNQGTLNKPVKNLDGKEFQCSICGISLSIALKLRHMKTHDDSFAYKCEICGRNYMTSQALRRHKGINHTDSKAKCKYCNKEFLHKDYAISHLKFCRVAKQKKAVSDIVVSTTGPRGANATKRMKITNDLAYEQDGGAGSESSNPSIPVPIPVLVKTDSYITVQQATHFPVSSSATLQVPVLIFGGDNLKQEVKAATTTTGSSGVEIIIPHQFQTL